MPLNPSCAAGWGQLDDVFGIEIGQLEPVFRDVRWREQIVLRVLLLQGLSKRSARDKLRLQLGFDGALDGQALGPLDDGGDDRAAGQVAAIEEILLAAAIGDFQELVLRRVGVMRLGDGLRPALPSARPAAAIP